MVIVVFFEFLTDVLPEFYARKYADFGAPTPKMRFTAIISAVFVCQKEGMAKYVSYFFIKEQRCLLFRTR